MRTTVRGSLDERELINKTARKQGYLTDPFVLMAVEKHLPLKEAPVFDKTIDRNKGKLCINISPALREKIQDNIDNLSTKWRKIKMWEIVLYCALKECEIILPHGMAVLKKDYPELTKAIESKH